MPSAFVRKIHMWAQETHLLLQSNIRITQGKVWGVVASNRDGSCGRAGGLVPSVRNLSDHCRKPSNIGNVPGQDYR